MSRITLRRRPGVKPSYEINHGGKRIGVLSQDQGRGCWYWYALDGGPVFNSLVDTTMRPTELGQATSAAREWARARVGGGKA